MTPERKHPLDTSALQNAYSHQDLPHHTRFGQGERYRFGSTLADVYPAPPDISPVVQVRMHTGSLALGDVLHVLPTQAGGLHVDQQNGACEVGKTGDLAYVYTPPRVSPPLSLSQDGPVRKDVYGRSYTQSSLEVAGTPEGVRVTIYGAVEAAPKPTNSKRGSPLAFFLVEYNPEKPDEPLRHEVWAKNKAREELLSLKLKKDDSIEALLYRHTWEVQLQGGKTETQTRHNLSTVLRVDRKGAAKRTTAGQEATSE